MARTEGADADTCFTIHEPARLGSPLVLSSPHSGVDYPAAFLASSRLDAKTLRRSEDTHVEDLFKGGVSVGAPLISAIYPRAFLDLNREPYELDPRMFEGRLPSFANTRSMRVAGGLGTIARIVGEQQEIYSARLPVAEAIDRIERFYKPYHAALRGLLARAQEQAGVALLVDCHSMPSTAGGFAAVLGARRDEHVKADFVIGDRYGASCDPVLVERAERILRGQGYAVQRNRPYAGGFITEHYGEPAQGVHAMQIEVNRAIYMNEATLERTARFEAIALDLTRVAEGLAECLAQWSPGRRRLAAE